MSYDKTATDNLNIARRLLGDVSDDDETEWLEDDEIDAIIALYGAPLGIAFLADGLVARFAQMPSSVGLPSGLSVAWSKRLDAWIALAKRLRADGTLTGGVATSFTFTPSRTDGYSEIAEAA